MNVRARFECLGRHSKWVKVECLGKIWMSRQDLNVLEDSYLSGIFIIYCIHGYIKTTKWYQACYWCGKEIECLYECLVLNVFWMSLEVYRSQQFLYLIFQISCMRVFNINEWRLSCIKTDQWEKLTPRVDWIFLLKINCSVPRKCL